MTSSRRRRPGSRARRGAGIGAAIAALALSTTGIIAPEAQASCDGDDPAGNAATPAGVRHTFERPAMGTLWRVVIETPDGTRAAQASEAFFARLDALNRVMSDYDPSSEVRQLGAEWRRVSGDLRRVLARSLVVADESGGAFDVTVGPLTRLWRRALRRGELPDEGLLGEARRAVGWQGIELSEDGRKARLVRPGARIDLGGIGKGFALDEGARLLGDAFGLPVFLIDGGGDLVVGDPPAGQAGWTVEVRGHARPFRLRVARVAVTTSGDLHQHAVIHGERYSHLVDPRTGVALRDGAAATVVAPSATDADALASAFCVLGNREGEDLAAARRRGTREGFAAVVSRADGTGWETGLGRWREGGGASDPAE